MAALDYFKREIQVGDLVVPLNSSTFWSHGGKPLVCTRIGSDDKVQINGSSYGNAGYFLVVNEQCAHAGMDCEAIRDMMREHFNFTPVEDKKPSRRFLLVAISDFARNINGSYTKDREPEFFVVSFQGNRDEMIKRYHEVTATNTKHQYHNYGTYKVGRSSNGFVRGFNDLSRKALLAVDPELDLMIDQKIDKHTAPELYERLCKI